MRNTLVVDMNNNRNITCVDSVAENENTINFLVYTSSASNPKIEIMHAGEVVATVTDLESDSIYFYSIPTEYYPVYSASGGDDNNLYVTFSDDNYTATPFRFHWSGAENGHMTLQKDASDPNNHYFVVFQKVMTQSEVVEQVTTISEEVTTIQEQITDMPATITNTVENADTIQTIFSFSRYILVQFLETNFDAIDVNKSYVATRKYIQIYDDNIKVIEAQISPTGTKNYTDPDGNTLYWTSIDGADAYKFFTYQSPLVINKSKQGTMSDAEFVDAYTVKVRTSTNEYVKCTLGFPMNESGTGEPTLVFGAGDGTGAGQAVFSKTENGFAFVYKSRTDGLTYGVAMDDGTVYVESAGVDYPMMIKKDYSSYPEADSDSALPVGAYAFVTSGS